MKKREDIHLKYTLFYLFYCDHDLKINRYFFRAIYPANHSEFKAIKSIFNICLNPIYMQIFPLLLLWRYSIGLPKYYMTIKIQKIKIARVRVHALSWVIFLHSSLFVSSDLNNKWNSTSLPIGSDDYYNVTLRKNCLKFTHTHKFIQL